MNITIFSPLSPDWEIQWLNSTWAKKKYAIQSVYCCDCNTKRDLWAQ